ncbi:DUF6232 family protein [Acetobacter aceti]|uniref:DUF6232 family protein n=1 Tax=Acetobacter aceti TaxID=435 RepID=UPI0011AF1C36|nr:DUF6232 family protein [Acetobacter aceti]
MSEEVYYQDKSVMVTKTLVRSGSASYPVSNIGSVLLQKQKITGLIVGVVILGLVFMGSVGAIVSPSPEDNSDPQVLFWITAFSGIFSAVCLFKLIKPEYYLIFRTSSSDQRAVASNDRARLASIQSAIEKAVNDRG